jgi:hypothetical protein
VTVEDSTTIIEDPSTGINFGQNLDVTSDGDGTVTVDGSGSSINTSEVQMFSRRRING